MSISPAAFPLASLSPAPVLVAPGIQFSCGRLISLVSSMLTILAPGGMKSAMEFSAEVLPEAVPPQRIIDSPFSTPSQRYAIISGLTVLYLSRSTGVKGLSLNRLMVNVEPRVETSRE
ncbi:MAG: hypothetical protein A4E32_00160 [Methanomassiliicoccales archaeon PtaU1.Bin124]|nr:MAG: hypothetical protein A4E32_00160 [Methanomassiliicoccales archaeon PtaU1.Bin124]